MTADTGRFKGLRFKGLRFMVYGLGLVLTADTGRLRMYV